MCACSRESDGARPPPRDASVRALGRARHHGLGRLAPRQRSVAVAGHPQQQRQGLRARATGSQAAWHRPAGSGMGSAARAPAERVLCGACGCGCGSPTEDHKNRVDDVLEQLAGQADEVSAAAHGGRVSHDCGGQGHRGWHGATLSRPSGCERRVPRPARRRLKLRPLAFLSRRLPIPSTNTPGSARQLSIAAWHALRCHARSRVPLRSHASTQRYRHAIDASIAAPTCWRGWDGGLCENDACEPLDRGWNRGTASAVCRNYQTRLWRRRP